MGLINDLICVGLGIVIGTLLLKPKAKPTPPKNPLEDLMKGIEGLKKKTTEAKHNVDNQEHSPA